MNKYSLFITGNYVGERYAINDTRNATSPVKSHFVLDGRISYKNKSLEAYIGINNILNEKYSTYVVKSTSSAKKDYYPSPERNFIFGILYKF